MLPKLDLPNYEFTVPSTKKTIKYRPFTVKEKKVLLMALENGSEKEVYDAIKQIINNCIVTTDVKVDDMATFDIEKFFIELRARSVGENITAMWTCNKDITGTKCNGVMEKEINLLKVKLSSEPASKTIKLSENVGIEMKYPTLKSIINDGTTDVDSAFKFIASCVDFIYHGDTITYAKDIPQEEVVDFIERLTEPQYQKISDFVSSIPTLREEFRLTCPKCNATHDAVVEGLQSFFV